MKMNIIQNLVLEVSELPEMVEQSLSPTPSLRKRKRMLVPVHESCEGCVANKASSRNTKRVTFNSNVTVYEYVPDHESIESFLPGCSANEEEKTSSHSISNDDDDDDFLTSSVGLYPRCDWDDYSDDDFSDVDIKLLASQVWTETVLDASMESRTGDSSLLAIRQQVETPMVKTQQAKEYGWRTNARDRSDYFHSVRSPVENILQWKAAMSKPKGTSLLKPHKENSATFEAPSRLKTKSNQLITANKNVAVDTSLSPCMKSKSSKNLDLSPSFKEFGWKTNARSDCVRNPVENILQWRAAKSRGTQKNYANFEAPGLSYGQTPSKFKKTCVIEQDKKVEWHSSPFQTRLDRALNRVVA